jgi:hypothetical protein
MGKVKEGISQGFQWHLKWVRVMFGASIIAIVAIILFPTAKKVAAPEVILYSLDSLYKRNMPVAADTLAMTDNASYFRFDSAGIDTTQPRGRMQPVYPMMRPERRITHAANKGISDNDTTVATSTVPIQIQLVEPKKPFDWKGTVTWLIGAINGLILVVLNIKNLIVKKRPI